MVISRRKLTKLSVAGLGLACGGTPPAGGATGSPLRVAAVQMRAELANVEANLTKAERLVHTAFRRGARWVILSELFPSGIAFYPDMAKTVRPIDGAPVQLLRRLARQGGGSVGGSLLASRDGNVSNSFVLALPDGSILRHDKDQPTFWENCCYIGGQDDGVLDTPEGSAGAALCWEFIRSKTAKRLNGRNLVVGGSCWWTAKDSDPPDHPFRKRGLETLKAAPGAFAGRPGLCSPPATPRR